MCYDLVYVFNICRIGIYVKDRHFEALRRGWRLISMFKYQGIMLYLKIMADLPAFAVLYAKSHR